MRLKDRRGSHVGMILSFVLFITFTLFIYVTVSPNINTAESKRILMNEIGLKIMEYASSDFSMISILINESKNPSSNCIQLNESLFSSGIGLAEFAEEEKISARVIIKNDKYQVQPVYYNQESNLSITINRTNNEGIFFKIYHSPEFEPSIIREIAPCSYLEFKEDYSIGSINTGNYIFEKKIYDLIRKYNSEYINLKNSLKISPGDEFGFEFRLNNGTKWTAMKEIPSSINIYAEELPVQYIDSEANILSGFIEVKVW